MKRFALVLGLIISVCLFYSAHCQSRWNNRKANHNRNLANSFGSTRVQRKGTLNPGYTNGKMALGASQNNRPGNRNNTTSPNQDDGSSNGEDESDDNNPVRNNPNNKARRNTLSKMAEYIVSLAGAMNRRDECIERFVCKISNFIPNFPWRGLLLMLLEPFSPLSSRMMSGIKAKVLLNDDCTRFFCYTQSLR